MDKKSCHGDYPLNNEHLLEIRNCAKCECMRGCQDASSYNRTEPEPPVEEANGPAPDPKARYYDAGGIETIDIIKAKLTPEEYRGYLLGVIIKYSCRLGHKGDAGRDAEKLRKYSEWLTDHFIEREDR